MVSMLHTDELNANSIQIITEKNKVLEDLDFSLQ